MVTGRFGRVEATDECDDCGRRRPLRELETVLEGETVRRVCPGCGLGPISESERRRRREQRQIIDEELDVVEPIDAPETEGDSA